MADKKAAIREYASRVAKMTDAERAELIARGAPIVTIEGHPLSIKNQCLVAMQHSGATVVGGYRQWQAAGRQVRKGESGLYIWIPCSKKTDDGGEDSFFIFKPVFDVSQTDEIEQAAELQNA